MIDNSHHTGSGTVSTNFSSYMPDDPPVTGMDDPFMYDPSDISEPDTASLQTIPPDQGSGTGMLAQLMAMIMQILNTILPMLSRLTGGEPGPETGGGTGEGGHGMDDMPNTGSVSTTPTNVNIAGFSTRPQTGPYTDAQAKATGEKLINHLMRDLGITRAQAAGIVGNIQAESDLNPGINQGGKFGPPGSGGAGFGWVQWSGSRRDEYVQFTRQQGLDPRSAAANYAFLVHELKGPYKGVLERVRSAGSSAQAAEIIFSQYEMPGDNSLGRRIGFASQWM